MDRRDRKRLLKLEPVSETVYLNRRHFMERIGFSGLAATVSVIPSFSSDLPKQSFAEPDQMLRPGIERPNVLACFPAPRNEYFNEQPGRVSGFTDEVVAATHNNFYEFYPGQAGNIWRLTRRFAPDPWRIQVKGLCRKPRSFDIDDIYSLFGAFQEERAYRFRCVEAWAMDVPWTGFEFRKILEMVEPTSNAKFVRFVTAMDPNSMKGIDQAYHYPWPYSESLRMDEALNPLTLLVTGIYGRPLPRQHGSPFRIVVPWKYGYKSAKSIRSIELTEHQPPTFWNTVAPNEYGFLSNIDPNIPHPRWSQKTERVLGTGDRRPTLLYGGYSNFVAPLYS